MTIKQVVLWSNGSLSIYDENGKIIDELKHLNFIDARKELKKYDLSETKFFFGVWDGKIIEIPKEHFFCEVWEYKTKKTTIKNGRLISIAFILTMPNCGSWNGKWSGEGNFYCRIRKIRQPDFDKMKKNFYYSWNDGWGASIELKKIDAKEATKMRKQSKGFCGYEWMIDSILKYGEILNSNQIKEKEMEAI